MAGQIGDDDIGWATSSSGGGGGSGTVTEVDTGTGLTGGPITSTGTISVATNTANTLAGYNNSGVFSDVAVGTGLALSSGTLTATGSSGVSSFTGDGVILNNSASTGAVTATQANTAAYSMLANATGSSAAVTAVPAFAGVQTLTTTTTLTANSPSYNICTTSSAGYGVTLPAASTCPGKIFYFQPTSNNHAVAVALNAADTYEGSASGATIGTIFGASGANLYGQIMGVISNGSANSWSPLFPSQISSGQVWLTNGGGGGICYLAAGVLNAITAGTAGQLIQSGGGGAPTWTSTPGSGTALTSITAQKSISAGTSPSIAGGGTLGSGGTVAFVGTAHDESGQITITAGTGATAAVVTLTYGNAAYAAAPNPVFSAANSAAAGLITQAYISSQSTTAFALTLGALAATTYIYNYIVKQ